MNCSKIKTQAKRDLHPEPQLLVTSTVHTAKDPGCLLLVHIDCQHVAGGERREIEINFKSEASLGAEASMI